MKAIHERYSRPVIPAAVVGLLLVGLWAWSRWGYLPMTHAHGGGGGVGSDSGASIPVFVGWLCAMFLAATVAVIIWAATTNPDVRSHGASRTFLGYAVLTDICGLLLLLAGTIGGMISFADAVRVYLILLAWLGLWTSVAVVLRRVGAGFSVVVTLAVALTTFAAPVTAVPLIRAAEARGPAAQNDVTAVVAHATPLLAVLDAVKPSFRVGWAQLPEMYHLSGLGQDIPMPLPSWWISTLAYAGIAVLLWFTQRATRPGDL